MSALELPLAEASGNSPELVKPSETHGQAKDQDTDKEGQARQKLLKGLSEGVKTQPTRAYAAQSSSGYNPGFEPEFVDDTHTSALRTAHFVAAAGVGALHLVAEFLDDGWDLNCKFHDALSPVDLSGHPAPHPPQGQTALIKAVRYGHFEVADLLLSHGADCSLCDDKFRTVWYYICFGIGIPDGGHARFAQLMMAHDAPITSREFHTAAYSNSSNGVAHILLDNLGYDVLSKDSRGACDMVFTDLHMLDDPRVEGAIVWPDGSHTPAGETAFESLVARSKLELLSHPSALALLEWKARTFGRALAAAETVAYMVLVLLLSIDILIVTVTDEAARVDAPGAGYAGVRGFLEGTALGLGMLFMAVEVWDLCSAASEGQGSGGVRAFVSTHVLSLGTIAMYVLLLVLFALRLAGEFWWEVRLAAVFIVLAWMRLVLYLQLYRSIGPFAITLRHMVASDVTRFLLMIAVILPGFGLAFSLITSVGTATGRDLIDHGTAGSTDAALREALNQEVQYEFVSSHRNVGLSMYSLVLIMTGVGFWSHANIDGTLTLLFVAFYIIVPVLLVSLLVAMLNSTFMRIQDSAVRQWVLEFARFLVRRQRLFRLARQAAGALGSLAHTCGCLLPDGRCKPCLSCCSACDLVPPADCEMPTADSTPAHSGALTGRAASQQSSSGGPRGGLTIAGRRGRAHIPVPLSKDGFKFREQQERFFGLAQVPETVLALPPIDAASAFKRALAPSRGPTSPDPTPRSSASPRDSKQAQVDAVHARGRKGGNGARVAPAGAVLPAGHSSPGSSGLLDDSAAPLASARKPPVSRQASDDSILAEARRIGWHGAQGTPAPAALPENVMGAQYADGGTSVLAPPVLRGLRSGRDGGGSVSGYTVGTAASAVSAALSRGHGSGKPQLQAWLAGALGAAVGGPASYGGAATHGAHASAAYAAVSNSRTKRRHAGAAPLAVPGATGAAYSAHGAGSDDDAAAMSALAGGVGGVLAELREGHVAVRREMAALKAAVAANATQHAEILQLLRSLVDAQR